MTSPKEIKNQVISIKKIQKITDAMQKVAVSKMRRAHQKMEQSIPYAKKILDVINHVANSDATLTQKHLQERKEVNRVGYIVVSSDRGLCGGLNANLFKMLLDHIQQFHEKNIGADLCLFGEKAKNFFHPIAVNVVAHIAPLGEAPQIVDLVGSIKVMLDAYNNHQIDRIFIAHNEFVSTMVQKPVIFQLLPLLKVCIGDKHRWDYIYEPAPELLLETLLIRYVETQVYQAVVDNIACEHVARMLAMKNATNNAKELIEDLQLMYNKARQATITQEIAEIIGGAAAV